MKDFTRKLDYFEKTGTFCVRNDRRRGEKKIGEAVILLTFLCDMSCSNLGNIELLRER